MTPTLKALHDAIKALTFADLQLLQVEDRCNFDRLAMLAQDLSDMRGNADVDVKDRTWWKVIGFSGSKIAAIKELRDRTNIGLAESKSVMDVAVGDPCMTTNRFEYLFENYPMGMNYVLVAPCALRDGSGGLRVVTE